MMKYEVWSEGYDDGGPAWLVNTIEAESFEEACCLATAEDNGCNPDLFSTVAMTYWGCRLFDNEKEARRSFG
jgi:hypothetical protein